MKDFYVGQQVYLRKFGLGSTDISGNRVGVVLPPNNNRYSRYVNVKFDGLIMNGERYNSAVLCLKDELEPVKVIEHTETPSGSTADQIIEVCDGIKEMLLNKNRRYGDSAIDPVRIFSSADPEEQINIRLDDKLSRIVSGQDDEDEDVLDDLIGYLILKKIVRKNKAAPKVNSVIKRDSKGNVAIFSGPYTYTINKG